MNQSLQICISQHLTLTPQLQQAIKLLQLSTFDLQHEIQQLIESNPMLEAIPNESKDEFNADGTESFAESSLDFQWSGDYPGRSKLSNFNGDAEINYEQFYCTTTTYIWNSVSFPVPATINAFSNMRKRSTRPNSFSI